MTPPGENSNAIAGLDLGGLPMVFAGQRLRHFQCCIEARGLLGNPRRNPLTPLPYGPLAHLRGAIS